MGGEIGAVKEYVSNLADAIGGVSASYRMALVDYKDDCDSYQSRVDVDFTSDVPTFKEGVSNLYADGGGDAAESVYSGLNTALDLDWRDGVRRSIFIIGDAPGKDPEPVTGFTQSDIVDKAIAEGVGIYPLGRVSSYGRARSMPSMPESNGNGQSNDQQNDAAPDAAPSKDESGAVPEPAAALLSDTLLSPAEATSGDVSSGMAARYRMVRWMPYDAGPGSGTCTVRFPDRCFLLSTVYRIAARSFAALGLQYASLSFSSATHMPRNDP